MTGTKRHPSGLRECDWCHQPATRTVHAGSGPPTELCGDCTAEWHRRSGTTDARPVDAREQRIADIAATVVPNDFTEFTPESAAAYSFEVAEAWMAERDRRVAALADASPALDLSGVDLAEVTP